MTGPVYTYSAGDDESFHDEDARFEWPDKLGNGSDRITSRDAEYLADDYHGNHDGWEMSWPLEIRVYRDGLEVARFDVDRESVPSFHARHIKLGAE